MDAMKSLKQIQEPLEVGLKVVIVLNLALVVMTPIAYAQYSKLPPSTKFMDTALWSDNVMAVLSLLLLVAGIGVFVMFLMWVYRATKNLRALTDYPIRQTPGWSVGWYFIPVAFLFKPYQGMTDIWKAAGAKSSSLRLAWWLTILGSSLIYSITDTGSLDVTVAEAQRFVVPDIVNAAGNAAIAVLTLILVSRIGNAYAQNVKEWSVESPAVPAGWYRDPSGAAALRYWDGCGWTEHVESAES